MWYKTIKHIISGVKTTLEKKAKQNKKTFHFMLVYTVKVIFSIFKMARRHVNVHRSIVCAEEDRV